MRNLLWGVAALLALTAPAAAQTTSPGGPDPMVCAYQSALPTLLPGQTGLVQCDAQGRIIISNPGGGGNSTVSPAPGTCIDTPRTLSAGTSTTLLSAGTYKSVSYMDIGTNPMTFVEGTAAAVVGNGMALNGATAAGMSGGSYTYSVPPSNAVQAISTAGTTAIVKVCN